MAVKFTNNAKTTLASSLTNVATSASVVNGSVFPTLGAGEYFYCTFDDGSNNEIVKVTARSGNTLTIVRGVDNTTARAFSTGDSAELRATAGLLTDIQENIAAKSANQTVYNTTTASSATSYDIGIDPSVEANAMVFLNGVMQHHDTFSFSGSTLTFDTAPSDGMALEVIVDNLINLQSSNLTVDTFTAADVGGNPQTDFTLSDSPAAETNLIVFVDGVFQAQDAYTISSNVLTMTDGVIADRVVTVYVINPVNIGTPSDGTVTSAKLSGNITMPANLTVTGDVAFDSPTFVVDNANSRVGIGTASPSTLLDIVGDVKMSADLTVDTNTLYVDSADNRVGIGTLDPSQPLHVDATGGGVIRVTRLGTSASAYGQLEHDGTNTSLTSSAALIFNSNGAYAGRFDSSGNLLVGKASLDGTGSNGIELRADGLGLFSKTGASDGSGQPMSLNRDTYDGTLLWLGKDGTGIGSIGIITQSGATNLVFDSTSAAYFDTNARPNVDNTYNLGSGSYRWKDLYLSGTANAYNFAATNTITIDNSSGYAAMELGGTSGAYIDLKNPSSDDYDLRLITFNTGGQIIAAAGSPLLLASSGNSNQLYLDSSGNVGIGTSSPSQKLETTGNIFINAASGNPDLTIKTAGTGNNPSVNYRAGDNIVFDNMLVASAVTDYWRVGYGASGTVTSEYLAVTSAGNVGIGTTNPAAPLHISKTDTYSAIISREDWNSGTSTKLALGKQYGVLGYISTDLVETTNDTTYIALNYKSGLSTYAEGLRVYNNGNVGINTTIPKCTLHVKGNLGVQTASSTIALSSGQADSGLNLATLHDSTRGAGRLRVIGTENALNNGYAEYFYVFSQSTGGTYYVNLKFIDEAVVNNNYGRPRLYLYNSSTYNANSTGRQNTDQTDSSTNSNILQIGITNVADAIGGFYLVAEPVYYP